jgi:chemotaxis protein methyltransferase CheR
MAIVLSEFAESNPGFNFQILATDISTRVLEKARNAVYDEERIAPVPSHLKKKYLLRSKDSASGLVRMAPVLRDKVRFGRLNFMDDDFGMREPFDIIFCRNVVIYFDRQTQERLVNKFHRNMRPGAHLFMGHSETLNGLDVPLVQAHPTVYRRER